MRTSGFLVVDKPTGITSRDAVDRAARWFSKRTRIGHAGTLDPLATGVLVLAVGQGTRLIEFIQRMPKVYRTRIVLGATSDTDDADGAVTPTDGIEPIARARIEESLAMFIGDVLQVPPAYSAIRVDGARAHKLARKGSEVRLEARPVRIDAIELVGYGWPEVTLEVRCGKGTYIRSIARDLGRSLGVGGYVRELRRTRIGPFAAEDAIDWNTAREDVGRWIRPLADAVEGMSRIHVDVDQERRVRTGQMIEAPGDGEAAAFDHADHLIAVGQVAGGRFRPVKVIPPWAEETMP